MDSVKQSYKQQIALDGYKAEGGFLSSWVFRKNNTRRFQRVFQQHPELPVYLKGKNDRLVFRGILGFAILAGCLSLFNIYGLATKKFSDKRNA
ncbi:hypothetical protein TrispH2_000371 [Trichoplax sp. H2]|nr:hypothetical protein TrispH2_000371 [Trichoplax sp. H2]|eukprot:RDD47494.1 hypothetical protein TrispH2_000371 [Trichoplax sp. H2]